MYARVVLQVILCAVLFTSTMVLGQVKLKVYAVNYPLQYFAQRIAGQHADVVLSAPAEGDPAFWQPSVEVIAGYQQADLILLNGANYSKWVNRVSLPRRKLVDTSAGFRDRYIFDEADATHSHGPGGEHSHAGTAFTTWLDFNQAAEQARAIADAMAQKRPEWETEFSGNLAALERDLLELDKRIKTVVAVAPDRPLVASHPVYQYFQRRYGINLKSMMWEPDAMPDEAQWAVFERHLSDHPARWMIWEDEPHPQIVQRLHAAGVQSAVFDPAGNRPDKGDFLSTMEQNVKHLKQVYK